jgi:hypothetical protein
MSHEPVAVIRVLRHERINCVDSRDATTSLIDL